MITNEETLTNNLPNGKIAGVALYSIQKEWEGKLVEFVIFENVRVYAKQIFLAESAAIVKLASSTVSSLDLQNLHSG